MGDGDWACEPSLWLHWRHMGTLIVQAPSHLLSLQSDLMHRVLRLEIPVAAKAYAQLFLNYAIENEDGFNDIFVMQDELTSLADEAFACYKVSMCKHEPSLIHAIASLTNLPVARGFFLPRASF